MTPSNALASTPRPRRWRRSTALLAATAALAGAGLPIVAAQSAGAATTVALRPLTPIADATVRGDHNSTRYGTRPYLSVDNSPLVRSYLAFRVTGARGPVRKAVLRLFVRGSNPVGAEVHGVVGNSWTERTVTFANASAFGPVVARTGRVHGGSWVNVDVTRLIKGNGTYSLVLTTRSSRGFSFSSRETGRKPTLLVTTSVGSTGTSTTYRPPATSVAPPTSGGKLLIHHGFDLPTPSQVAAHAAIINSRPLDGITVYLGGLSDSTLTGTAISQAQYASALSPMPALTRAKHNFVIVRTMHPLSWYDSTQWSTIASNFRNLTAALKAKGGFDGIFFDTEWYGSGAYPWNYGSGGTPWSGSDSHSASTANATVMGRGKQVASAMAAAWPYASLISTYGPWVGETRTCTTGGWCGFGYSDTAWTNELMGSFTGGMAAGAAAHPGFRYVDGGEIYQAHSPAEYQKAYSWEKSGLAASGSRVVAGIPAYSSHVSAGFGVYDKDMRIGGWPVMPASTWQYVLTNALKRTDKYVWAYSEAYDWLGSGWPSTTVPASIVNATVAAVNAAR